MESFKFKEPHEYFYMVYNKAYFSFQTTLTFGFINHPNKCLKWILCIGPIHNVYYFPFQSDCLSKFQFHTFIWPTPWKNPICQMKIIKNFTWFKLCQIICEIDVTFMS